VLASEGMIKKRPPRNTTSLWFIESRAAEKQLREARKKKRENLVLTAGGRSLGSLSSRPHPILAAALILQHARVEGRAPDSCLVASVVEMNCRKGAKSSTTRMRADDTRARASSSKMWEMVRGVVSVFVPISLLLCPSSCSIEFPPRITYAQCGACWMIVPGKRGVSTVAY